MDEKTKWLIVSALIFIIIIIGIIINIVNHYKRINDKDIIQQSNNIKLQKVYYTRLDFF